MITDNTLEYENLLTGPVVKVVLLRQTDTQTVPMLGATPIDVNATVLSAALVEELVDSATTLDASVGVPVHVVEALLLEPVPVLFAHSPWLHDHRALTFTAAGTAIGGHIFRYHEEFGVFVDEDA